MPLGERSVKCTGCWAAAGLQTTASPQSAPNSHCAIAASPHKRSGLSVGSCRQPQRPMIDWGQTEASAVSISAPAKKAELPGSDVRKEETCPPLPISTHASVSFREDKACRDMPVEHAHGLCGCHRVILLPDEGILIRRAKAAQTHVPYQFPPRRGCTPVRAHCRSVPSTTLN